MYNMTCAQLFYSKSAS